MGKIERFIKGVFQDKLERSKKMKAIRRLSKGLSIGLIVLSLAGCAKKVKGIEYPEKLVYIDKRDPSKIRKWVDWNKDGSLEEVWTYDEGEYPDGRCKLVCIYRGGNPHPTGQNIPVGSSLEDSLESEFGHIKYGR